MPIAGDDWPMKFVFSEEDVISDGPDPRPFASS